MSELRFRNRSSEEQHTLDLKIWANAVGEYPLYAVQKAANLWTRGARDGDELKHFLADVRLYSGHNVLERKRLLERMNNQ